MVPARPGPARSRTRSAPRGLGGDTRRRPRPMLCRKKATSGDGTPRGSTRRTAAVPLSRYKMLTTMLVVSLAEDVLTLATSNNVRAFIGPGESRIAGTTTAREAAPNVITENLYGRSTRTHVH